MSKRITLSQQLESANATIKQMQEDRNLLVAEANKRINEAFDEGYASTQEVREDLQKQVEDLTDKIIKLTKELDSMTSNKKYYSDRSSELAGQISAVHDMLDLIPTCLPRHKGEDKYSDYPLITRLMSYFVNKAQ